MLKYEIFSSQYDEIIAHHDLSQILLQFNLNHVRVFYYIKLMSFVHKSISQAKKGLHRLTFLFLLQLSFTCAENAKKKLFSYRNKSLISRQIDLLKCMTGDHYCIKKDTVLVIFLDLQCEASLGIIFPFVDGLSVMTKGDLLLMHSFKNCS